MNRRWFGSVMLFWSLYPAFIFLNTSVSSGMTKRKSNGDNESHLKIPLLMLICPRSLPIDVNIVNT